MTGDYDCKMLTPVTVWYSSTATCSHNPDRVLLEGFVDIILRMLLYDTEDIYGMILRIHVIPCWGCLWYYTDDICDMLRMFMVWYWGCVCYNT